MPTRSSVLTLVCVAWMGLTSAACQGDSPPPGAPPSPPSSPGTPATEVRLELQAPARIAPGESVQLTATIVMSDGSRENASGRVAWRSDTAALRVSATGLATGVTGGESQITASSAHVNGQARVLVLPQGTFTLTGTTRLGTLGVEFVDVRILSGIGAGLTSRTNASGVYTIYGVAGRVDMEIRRDGYHTRTVTFDVSDHHTFDVQVDPDLQTTGGVWTLTITAGPCNSGSWTLPESARQRTYTVLIVENDGARVSMFGRLSGAEFVREFGAGDAFGGFRDHVTPHVALQFGPRILDEEWGNQGYSIFERLSADTALAIVGEVHTMRGATFIEGRLSGSFELVQNPPGGPVVARCDSPAHEFKMRR